MKDIAPALLEFVSRRDIKETTVAAGLENRAWIRQIAGGIIVPAIIEYLRPCLVPQKFCKIFQIPRHIESLDVCMEY